MTIFPIGAKVGADTSAFVSSMGAATLGLKAFTGGAALAGAAIGVGLAVAMVKSVNAAREFQVELVKLNTLVGIQVEQIQEWEGAIKDLAIETGRMPADLTRAMFAITSGGARGQEALDLLKFSAQASAQGLGDMVSIGRTATAMLQAFGDEGLIAEKAIDIMVATVREGNLEAAGLATAFARVLGPAKKLGSSVEEIGGFLATFTRLGGSTEEAATGLLNIFSLLIKTPKDAREAMVEYGFSIEEVRATLAEDGLPAALKLMNDQLGTNVDALGRVIPNVRALIAFLSTAGLQGKEFAAITDRITDSLHLGSEGFEAWGDSADATFTRFSATMDVVAISIGELLLPPLTDLLDLVTRMLGPVREINDEWAEFFRLIGTTEAVKKMGEFMEALGLSTKEAADNTAQLLSLISEASDERLGENADRQARRVSALRREIKALNAEIQVEADLPTIETDIPGLVKMRAELEELEVLYESEADALEEITKEQIKRAAAEARANAEVEESIELSGEDAEALKERQEAIRGIISSLQDELLVLREGAAALLDKQLVELQASPLTRIIVALLLEEIQAEKDLAEAVSETAREKDRATKAEKRRLDSLKQKRERENEQRRRALERADLARLNDEMREATRIARQMADTIGTAFDDIISGAAGVGEAFGDMVTEILRQIQRLLIQRAIVEPLLQLILGQIGPSSSATGTDLEIVPQRGPDAQLGDATLASVEGPETGRFGVTAAAVQVPEVGQVDATVASASTASQPTQTVIVQQTIEIHNDMIDQQSGDDFIRRHAPRIAQILGEGVRESGDLATAIQR